MSSAPMKALAVMLLLVGGASVPLFAEVYNPAAAATYADKWCGQDNFSVNNCGTQRHRPAGELFAVTDRFAVGIEERTDLHSPPAVRDTDCSNPEPLALHAGPHGVREW